MAEANGMRDALLPRNGDEELGGSGVDAVAKVGWKSETAYLLGLSAPAIMQLAAQQGLVVTNQVIAPKISSMSQTLLIRLQATCTQGMQTLCGPVIALSLYASCVPRTRGAYASPVCLADLGTRCRGHIDAVLSERHRTSTVADYCRPCRCG
jgi:hypothetical protein